MCHSTIASPGLGNYNHKLKRMGCGGGGGGRGGEEDAQLNDLVYSICVLPTISKHSPRMKNFHLKRNSSLLTFHYINCLQAM